MRVHAFNYNAFGSVQRAELHSDAGPLLKPILGKLGISLLVGRNGSGKSTFASTLVRLLFHVDWKQERIPAKCAVDYSLARSGRRLRLASDADTVALWVGGHARKIRDTSVVRVEHSDPTLLPDLPNVVCSVFSTRGEYPAPKPPKAYGHRHVAVYDVAGAYGANHYQVGSLSSGLRRFVSPEFADARKTLQRLTGIKVMRRVRAFPTAKLTELATVEALRYSSAVEPDWEFGAAEWRRLRKIVSWLTPDWLDVSKAVLDAERDGLVYINDVELRIPGLGKQSLMTLSAGQKMLLVRLLSILARIEDDTLVIVEEPELHLDPSWCGRLIELFGAFFGRFACHMIVASQSLSFVRCVPARNIVEFEHGQPRTYTGHTFLASEAIVGDMYRASALSSLDNIVLRELATVADAELRASLVQSIGEGPVRFLARRELESQSLRS